MKIHPDGSVRAAGILLFTGVKDKQEFLLMKHPRRWDLPKGHCELGETFREAALRETHEETGIQPKQIEMDPDFLFELSYPVTYKKTGDKEFQKTVQYFLGVVNPKPKIILTEHDDSKWFQWNPPHAIQAKTIDPLLLAAHEHFQQ